MFEKVLVCLDGAAPAEQVLPYIAESCSSVNGEIVLLQVVNTGITIPPPQSIHVPPLGGKIKPQTIPVSDIAGEYHKEPQVATQLEEIERRQQVNKRYLEKLASPLRKNGLDVRTVIREGDAPKVILDFAERNHVSLIALTAHGQGGPKRGLGSVARYLLENSAFPILLIRPQ